VKFLHFLVVFVGEELTAFGFVREQYEKILGTTGLDICIFARLNVHCEIMPLRSFANFELVMSRYRKELRRALGHGLLGLCVNPVLDINHSHCEWAFRSLLFCCTCRLACVNP